MKKSSGPPLLVPTLLWGGGEDSHGFGGGNGSLYKVPFHTLGSAKRRYLRLKPFVKDENEKSSWIEVALVDSQTSSTQKYHVVRAACPLALVWNDPKSTSDGGLLSSPFKRSSSSNDHDILLQDIVRVAMGNRTPAFQAFAAKNGNWSIPNESCCFSLISAKRSVDFYIMSEGANVDGRDAKLASAWRDSIQMLLDNFHRKQNQARSSSFIGSSSVSTSSKVRAMKRWDSKAHSQALFGAAKSGDIGTLRWFFDHDCPVDFMDTKTGDTVLIIACRLGLYDVAKLALLGYNARNDPHPEFGQTALQVAVSAGQTKIVQLLLETAEPSGADRIISNHEDENGEAPLHVASRCGSMEIMELLTMHGANLGLVDGRGRTCLHCAAQSGEASCLTFALDSGADEYLEVFSHDGFTPLHTAVRANKAECVKVLLQAGADVTAEAANGDNVYTLASKQRISNRVTNLLLEYDVSEGDSYYDSYGEDDDDSEEDLFRGLNTYTVGGSPTNPAYSSGSVGGLISPEEQNRDFHRMQMSEGLVSPGPAEGVASHHSHHSYVTGINYSPIVGSNHQLALGYNSGHFSPNQNRVRFDAPYHCREEEYGHEYREGEEFCLRGEIWTIHVTNDGWPYFYNTNQDSSTWEDPRLTFAEPPMMRTPQTFSPHGSMNVATARNFSGQNHDTQTQPKEAISSPYTKLTAIPQLNLNPTLSPKRRPPHGAPPSVSHAVKPGDSADQGSEALGEHHQQRIPQHHSPKTATRNTATSPVNVAKMNSAPSSPTTDARIADPKSMLLSEIKSRSIETSPKIQTSEPPSTHGDPKSILLAQIKSRAASIDPISARPQTAAIEERADPKRMLLSQIQSRALSNVDPKACAQTNAAVTRQANENHVDETPPRSKSSTKQSKDNLKNKLMQDEAVKKFIRMASVGVPAQAVCHKMKQEGVDEDKIEMFKELHGLNSPAATLPIPPPRREPTKRQKYANVSKEDLAKDGTLSKYMKMKAVGVPLMAIVTKMSQDGIDKEKIHMFSVAFGLQTESAASPKPFPMPPIHSERRRASKAMQKIHWTSVSEDRLTNSLWASSNAEDEIKDCEIERLESLFSASPVKRSASVKKKAAVAKQKPTSLIDPKRANNIAIALAQFRAFANFDDLIQAVVSLDGTHLNVEKLQNMQLLLPKPEEINNLQQFDGKSDGLGRAELFFLSVMKVPRFSKKLQSFKFSLQFDELEKSLRCSLELLQKACTEVIESKKLAGILRRLLAIGNLMNASSGKPQAKGITLDSLLKTAKKRGSDGKTAVIDLLVSAAMNNKLDIVEFWSDMPTVRDAMRMDLDDLGQMLREIETGAERVSCSMEAEKSQVESQNGGSENYITKLSPFLKRAKSEIEDMQTQFSLVEGKVQSLCSFFAEDFKTCKASSIFGVLLDFSRLVDKSKEQHLRKERSRKRREMAQNRQKPN